MHACIEWAGRDAPGTYDLATRLLPVSGLSASGRSENLCVCLEGEGGLHVSFDSWISQSCNILGAKNSRLLILGAPFATPVSQIPLHPWCCTVLSQPKGVFVLVMLKRD